MEIKIKGKWLLLELPQRIDSFNHEHVTSKINTILKMGKKHIAMDSSQLAFLSFPGLRYILKVAKELKKNEGQLSFISPQIRIKKNINSMNKNKDLVILDQIEDLDKR